MSVIALEGMRFFANHGVYDEERILGGEYLVDVLIEADVEEAGEEDELNKTVNYELIYTICDIEMSKPSDLIENVLQRIMIRIKENFNIIQQMTLKVTKLNPPLGGTVKSASIESDYDFTTQCGRCNRGMICYGDETCWCNETKTVHQRTSELVEQEYGSCVCPRCLDYYAG